MAGPTILHADLDAFYASVEQLLDPTLRGRPIAVGGSPRGGVVLAASYEAKAHGVAGGMPGSRAAQLCPRLVFVRGRFDRYQALADRVMGVLGDVTPLVQRISIDEAFLDVSGATHLFGPPAAIGAEIRRRVRREVGLAISVGAAGTKHLAKVASQVAKPDGLVVVEPGEERDFLDPLPVRLMWGVGPVAERRLAGRGIRTIGDLARASGAEVEGLLGRAVGGRLGALAANEDPRRVVTPGRARSVSAQSALGRRTAERAQVRATLGHLAERVAGRLREKGRAGCTVTVRVRFAGMRSVTRSRTLAAPIATTLTMTEVAEQLAWQAIDDQGSGPVEISLLSVSVSALTTQDGLQLELPLDPDDPVRPGSATGAARLALDRAMDDARRRYGRGSVGYLPATLRSSRAGPRSPASPGAGPAGGRGSGPGADLVPDAFRELAERPL